MTGRRAICLGTALLGITIMVVALVLIRRGPERLDLSVGVHELSVILPGGFEVVEHDGEILFRDGLVMVALMDRTLRGPVPDAGPAFDNWVQLQIRGLGFTVQREVSHRDTLQVQGRTFRIIETWDRLSHSHPRRYALALNGGSLLVLHTRPGDFSRAAPAWDEILHTIAFRDP